MYVLFYFICMHNLHTDITYTKSIITLLFRLYTLKHLLFGNNYDFIGVMICVKYSNYIQHILQPSVVDLMCLMCSKLFLSDL